ncbi:MAG: pyruvate ferredoxin oxidoreductase [Candidatus Hydrothermae bacterium]|nr:pyruvate ferredoxin oxidoreductase [Candidatus Hydrothermae bacterium]
MTTEIRKKVLALTGNEAYAYAMKQINPDVVAAYPITPATEIVQIFSKYVADGEVDTEFVPVESEHSAMSACVGASAAGARVMTATASQGLALMHEVLYVASALRLPIVLAEVNRALSAPINIHCDHSDTMGSRDAGWIQIYSENADEAYQSLFIALKIAERANIPAMVTMDGFIVSHGMEPVEILPDEKVRQFLGERKPLYTILDVEHPITIGPLDLTDYFFEHKRGQIEAIKEAKKVIPEVHREYNEFFGKNMPDFFEPYRMEDAEIAVISLGSASGTVREAVDVLREKGEKVGALRMRIFRPFPYEKLREYTGNLKVLSVMDRADSLATIGGPVFNEVRSWLYDLERRPFVMNFVYGLGGRDFFVEDALYIFEKLIKAAKGERPSELIEYVGVRE